MDEKNDDNIQENHEELVEALEEDVPTKFVLNLAGDLSEELKSVLVEAGCNVVTPEEEIDLMEAVKKFENVLEDEDDVTKQLKSLLGVLKI